MWGIIGGSGFEKFEGFEVLREIDRSTPFGQASSGFKKVRIGKQECLFLSRHGAHHELTPSEVNYRANIFAMKQAGAKAIVSFSAVGSLREQFKPGDLVVPYQYIDRTKSIRKHTYCGDGLVGHTSLAKPVCVDMAEKLKELATVKDQQKKYDTHFGQTYVCIEGPTFSTIAESHQYRAMGADIIGMTHFPEYALAREAGLSYLPCCFITDYDCWDQSRPHVTLEEVITVMRGNNVKGFEILKDILNSPTPLYQDCHCADEGLKVGLMTAKEMIPLDKRKWVEVLTT